MGDPIQKNAFTQSQSESVKLSVDREGVLSLKDISSESKRNVEIMTESECNEEKNGYIDVRGMIPTNYESLQLSELTKLKPNSPTLIESAIQVMKNLFSPEKVKSKTKSVLISSNNSLSASGSPCISTGVSGKPDLLALEPESEIHSNIHFVPGENYFKSSQNNEFEMLQNPLTLDPLNNTDESFMTTVSLIDDSFHSAVTNLDEQGEFLRNGASLKDNILNTSRDSDFIEPSNDTLENNDSCLENTMLKIVDFSSDGNKLTNFSVQNKNELIKNFSSTQSDEENFSEEVLVNEVQCDDKHLIQSEKDLKSEVLEILNEINSKEEMPRDVKFQGNFKESALLSGNCPEIHNTKGNSETSDIYWNNSFTKETSAEQNKVLLNGLEKIPKENERNKINLDSLNNEGNYAETSISTTTIVLNTGESVDLENMLLSLKGDDSGTNISTLTYEGDDLIYSLENEEMPELGTHRSVASNNFLLNQQERYCVSENNSPNRSESTKTKLNKSDELLNRRGISQSLEKNKSLADFSLMKYSEASEISKKSDNIKFSQNITQPKNSENNKSHMDTSSINTDPVVIASQQSYTILTVQNKSLNRPVIEPLNINGDFPEQLPLQKNDTEQTLSSDLEKCFESNSSNGFFDSEDLENSYHVKQSTPLWERNNETSTKFFRPTNLKLHSPEINEYAGDCTKTIKNLEESNLCNMKAKHVYTINESSDGSLMVNNTDFIFLNSMKDELGVSHQGHIISNSTKENKIHQSPGVKSEFNKSQKSPENPDEAVIQKLNQTFDKNQQPLKTEGLISYKKCESHSTHPLNQTFETEFKSPCSNSKSRLHDHSQTPTQDKLNFTFDINMRSPSSNKTFTKEPTSPEIGEANLTFNKSESSEPALLNKTFDKPLNNQLNQTFSKKEESPEPQKLNETFNKKSESPLPGKIIQVSDDKLEAPLQNASNQTFVLDNIYSEKSIQESNQFTEIVNAEKSDNAFPEGNETNEKKTEASINSEKLVLNEGQPYLSSDSSATAALQYRTNNNTECDSNDTNESFASTKSSNTSLFCSDISTVVFNDENCAENRSIDDLSKKLKNIDLNENSKKDYEFVSSVSSSEGVSFVREAEEQTLQTEENLLNSLKDDKLPCDPDLVQLIREQFSSNDIEKICSVVQDLSFVKLTNDILKANEEFDKSHGNPPDLERSHPKVESSEEKNINPLSPQSFDFLNSIGGKPTGRDLSRESLYVKFDPLVQPSANSLIDFTKEGEALAANDSSPVNAHSSSICEQLLTISPQKKPDAIVPPLTPLSHKVKIDSNEDKLERLKELQNEIYFLKNLYAERERSNKTKMEEYENQIAKLTGESCMLEDKLKESNEREKSLVKKMKEQTQSIGQLKIIMEEYVKVISKLSSELEAMKNENSKQFETLSHEKDSYMTHLQNTEAAFTDVHTKYEKSKKTIVNLKANETVFKNTIVEQTQKLEEFKSKAKEAQEKALSEFQKIQEELQQTKASHSQEVARLKAQLRKTELKVEALQESLDQKIKENQQLTAICDELIEGKK